jgi:hypothetical protein
MQDHLIENSKQISMTISILTLSKYEQELQNFWVLEIGI